MVVSATGTGKTYLAAFEIAQAQPNRVLFVVHREQIARSAMASFKRVLGGPNSDYGLLTGNHKDYQAKYLLATIQTIAKDDYLTKFAKDHFDYILIDEVHKAGARSYLKMIDYFQPKFLLGLTATPERTDDFNIYELFDFNLAYEIRLQEALGEDMLSPFHYFGVSDYEIDGEVITDTTDLKYLTINERVNFLIEKINYYGCSGNKARGLVFCSRREEASKLADEFTLRGIPSRSLTGEDDQKYRLETIEKLEAGELNYIFTVDIFNEGVDIPMINQVIMLRNTQSSIIFIQQMGRGLRKHHSKEFVTIIDFIGNYKNNYMIPMALTGDVGSNRDQLRRDVFDTHYVQGLSSINFEEIAKEKIFKAIDQAPLDNKKVLEKQYQDLKYRLNRVPGLADCYQSKTVDPLLIANKFNTYFGFLVNMEDNKSIISATADEILKFMTRELLPGKRVHELLLLDLLIHHQTQVSREEMIRLFQSHQLPHDERTIQSVINSLDLRFYKGSDAKNYQEVQLLHEMGGVYELTDSFRLALADSYFYDLMIDLLACAQMMAREYDTSQRLTLNKKYSRKEAIRFLGWQEQVVAQNIGGYTYSDGEFAIFVTLNKGEDFQGALMAYEDRFRDLDHLIWFTRSPRTMQSPEIALLKDHQNWRIHLFIKKSDDDGADFYYLGECRSIDGSFQEIEKETREGKHQKVVELELKLETPVNLRLYNYLNQ
ncbi:DUF3427 domain-containing protein [Hutsoniella sourekii]|uniref:DUF3427 domain-containing protein n=1 Tax=Hutsoniella sourekii TaxID=87650 RepID=UPI003899699C